MGSASAPSCRRRGWCPAEPPAVLPMPPARRRRQPPPRPGAVRPAAGGPLHAGGVSAPATGEPRGVHAGRTRQALRRAQLEPRPAALMSARRQRRRRRESPASLQGAYGGRAEQDASRPRRRLLRRRRPWTSLTGPHAAEPLEPSAAAGPRGSRRIHAGPHFAGLPDPGTPRSAGPRVRRQRTVQSSAARWVGHSHRARARRGRARGAGAYRALECRTSFWPGESAREVGQTS
jgi:translation initiation factor IF-2